MKELNKFRQFLTEGKEETNEIFGMGKKNHSKKGEMALDFSAFVEELFDEGVISKELHNKLSSGVAELYSNVMDAEPGEVQKTYDYEPFVDDGLEEEYNQNQTVKNADPLDDGKYKNQLHQKLDLDENDSVLDELINEAKPNLKKALPKIAARNVERNNAINFDIESMMDMVGEAGKGEDSKEAKILFKASNASSDLEQALVDLQIHFEDDLDEGYEGEFKPLTKQEKDTLVKIGKLEKSELAAYEKFLKANPDLPNSMNKVIKAFRDQK